MLIQQVAPGDVFLCGHFCAIPWTRRLLCAAKMHVGVTLRAESDSTEFIRVHRRDDGYSVEEQLAARMRFLAQRPMVRYTIRRSLGGLKSG